MSKTPYELRFDVLQMARDLCMDEYHQNANAFWGLHAQLEEKLKYLPNDFHAKPIAESLQRVANQLIAAIPTMPTSEQINKRAKELYEFVSDNRSSW
jgi:hypothetical protein